ncbi:lyase family protein [Cryobacterium zhongshanensis]|uniref:Lyase family protein n=1 Tax=Cryobacterium zhongshanensis TaxID=2928153 RepID=A0AA41UFL4_9MICO|nr:lyase family protein [Cryobacterium zhongshanensis]MCI4658748.1 lyase family protein [Cryobacterium zhongshanensis]
MPEPVLDAGLLAPLAHGSEATTLTSDAAWLQAMVDTELALTRALVDAALAPEWMLGVCDTLADAGALDLGAIAREGRGGGNPVIPLVKHLGLAAERVRAGSSDHIHVGATSQDILDTSAMLIADRVCGELADRLGDFAAALAVLAGQHRNTIMAGRTLGQQASPTSFGFVAAGWLDAVLTAATALARVRAALPAQLGGAVGNLAVLTAIANARSGVSGPAASASGTPAVDVVTERFAARLGLRRPLLSWHTDRLPVVELGSALAAVTGVAGAFALDVSVLSRTEIAEVNERLGAGQGGSSAMPHKRNPVTAVLVTAAARQSPALLGSLYGSLLAEDQRPSGAWHAEWQTLRDLERLAVSAVTGAADLAGRLDIHPGRMRVNLEFTDGLVFSERVTTLLAEALGRTRAFALVQRAAEESHETRRPLRVTLGGLLAAEGSTAGVTDALRAQAWAAFDADTDLGQGSAAIDRVLARFRAQFEPDAPAEPEAPESQAVPAQQAVPAHQSRTDSR